MGGQPYNFQTFAPTCMSFIQSRYTTGCTTIHTIASKLLSFSNVVPNQKLFKDFNTKNSITTFTQTLQVSSVLLSIHKPSLLYLSVSIYFEQLSLTTHTSLSSSCGLATRGF